ncbi:MAG: hypothetical protein H0S82_02465 [Anaerolineaceae bacterium]|nr:hypothetical protein [Anaerolineaceae bacterium]
MKCDICTTEVNPRRAYIITTTQVVGDPGYWKMVYGLMGDYSVEQIENGLPGFIKQMAGSESDWVICEDCMSHLSADKNKAKNYFQEYQRYGKRPNIPGSGPGNLDQAIIVANGAFQAVFGRKPRTVQVDSDDDPVISSVEFSNLVVDAIRSGDQSKFARLADYQVRCKSCGAVMPAVETRMEPDGMKCPRCASDWFVIG